MKVKMEYTPLIEYKKARENLGVSYNEKYWENQINT